MLTVNRQRIFKCLELLEEAGAAISRASLQLLEIPEFSAEREVLQTLKKTVREHWDEIFEKREKQLQPSTEEIPESLRVDLSPHDIMPTLLAAWGMHHKLYSREPMAKIKPLSLNKDQQNEVTKALALIEDAQRKINMSAAMLCPIPGFGDEWAMSSGVYDHIKAYWHLVNDRKNRIALGLEKESVS